MDTQPQTSGLMASSSAKVGPVSTGSPSGVTWGFRFSKSFWTSSALDNAIVSKAVDAYDAGSTLEEYKVSRDGKTYYEFDFTYTEKLAPGAMTFWNAWGNIAIDKNATAEDLAGVETFDVIIEADAIQAEGFESYVDAFQAFDAEK